MSKQEAPLPANIELPQAPPDTTSFFAESVMTSDSPKAISTVVDKSLVSTARSVRSKTGAVRSVLLKDVRDIMRTSIAMRQVTLEQIERVRHMHDRFEEGARFSFNYNTLLLVASILAGLGLVSNSSTTIIASMLVSPIMGPVVGMAYGATIHDWRLFKMAFRSEIFSLLFCVMMGLLLGVCTGWTNLAEEWPTSEMATRATWQNFMVGLPIAFFSGLGVAVSLLDDQTSSLVGVAISASLLPPAVNAGILWVAYGFYKNEMLAKVAAIGEGAPEASDSSTDFALKKKEFWEGGAISLLLTVANIVIIIASSMLMFRMKEVRLAWLCKVRSM
jgi:uncharacterized hydrophobic protein (TIGR00271 family)